MVTEGSLSDNPSVIFYFDITTRYFMPPSCGVVDTSII